MQHARRSIPRRRSRWFDLSTRCPETPPSPPTGPVAPPRDACQYARCSPAVAFWRCSPHSSCPRRVPGPLPRSRHRSPPSPARPRRCAPRAGTSAVSRGLRWSSSGPPSSMVVSSPDIPLHIARVPILIGTDPDEREAFPRHDQAVSDALTADWTRFELTLDPNHAGSPPWPALPAGRSRAPRPRRHRGALAGTSACNRPFWDSVDYAEKGLSRGCRCDHPRRRAPVTSHGLARVPRNTKLTWTTSPTGFRNDW